MKQRKICYHGTNKKGYNGILEKGYFDKYTYFAAHLEDALGFGGKYIFEVCFFSNKVPSHWQFIVKKKYSIKNIVRIKYHSKIILLTEDKQLGSKIFKSAMLKMLKNKSLKLTK